MTMHIVQFSHKIIEIQKVMHVKLIFSGVHNSKRLGWE